MKNLIWKNLILIWKNLIQILKELKIHFERIEEFDLNEFDFHFEKIKDWVKILADSFWIIQSKMIAPGGQVNFDSFERIKDWVLTFR